VNRSGRSDPELFRPSISKSQKRSRGCSLNPRGSVRYCLVFKDLYPSWGTTLISLVAPECQYRPAKNRAARLVSLRPTVR
jgi:hypothetical protein